MNIGGSLFSSSSPEIFNPLPFTSRLWPGVLQVSPDEANDTHHLMLVNGNSWTILASHPNGFSCHALARHISKGDADSAVRQLVYIIACGGTASAVGASVVLSVPPLCGNSTKK